MAKRKRAPRVAHTEKPEQESFVSDEPIESSSSTHQSRTAGQCRCGAPRAAGALFCAECAASFAKLWSTPPDPRYGPCREVE